MPLSSFETTASQLCMSWSIDTSVEHLWECLTEPSSLGLWLGDLVAGSVSSGSSFTIDHGDGYRCDSTLVAREVGRVLAYSWRFPDEPVTEVSWTLSPGVSGTTLSLTHAGLKGLVSSYRDGWMTHLILLEAPALGTPLPPTMFWKIHATIAYLSAKN